MNEKRVFNYRSPMGLVAPVFFTVWGVGALVDIVPSFGHMVVSYGHENARPATQTETLIASLAFGGIAVVLLVAAPRLLLAWMNERVVIQDGEILWFDWLNRLKVRGSLASATPPVVKGMFGQGANAQRGLMARTTTDGGEIVFRGWINGFAPLVDLLTKPLSAAHVLTASRVPAIHVERQSFSYRWTYLHLFSFLWLGILLFMLVMSFVPGTGGATVTFYLLS